MAAVATAVARATAESIGAVGAITGTVATATVATVVGAVGANIDIMVAKDAAAEVGEVGSITGTAIVEDTATAAGATQFTGATVQVGIAGATEGSEMTGVIVVRITEAVAIRVIKTAW